MNNNISISNDMLLELINSIRWLIDECESNYTFAEDLGGSEYEALENLKDKVAEFENILDLEGNN